MSRRSSRATPSEEEEAVGEQGGEEDEQVRGRLILRLRIKLPERLPAELLDQLRPLLPYGIAIWPCRMALPYGLAIRPCHMALPHGLAMWLC